VQPPAEPGETPTESSRVRERGFAPAADGNDLQLLLDWRTDADESLRRRYAAIGTVAIHLLFVMVALLLPHSGVDRDEPREHPMTVTKLFDPPTELTQKAPNKGPLNKQLTAESIAPSPKIQSPAPGAAARKFVPPPQQQAQAKRPMAGPSVVEPPRIEQAQNYSPQIPQMQLPQQAQPSVAKPKLAFENVPSQRPTQQPQGGSRIAVPGSSVQDAVHALAHGGAGGGQSVGDSPANLGRGAGMNLPPSAGRQRTNLELKSDAMGVDFRPYLLQVYAIVRRNWFSVYPESAKLGTRGQTKVLFAVAKNGTVAKVVLGQESGLQVLDRAAIAALSQSNPLPALPSEFKGDRIVLEMTFSYNVPIN